MPEINVSRMLGELLSGMAREIGRGAGPVKWCRTCGRKHGTRAGCGLTKIAVEAKSGRMVERYTLGPRGD